MIITAVITGCQGSFTVNIPDSRSTESFSYNEYPLERAGISLHLDRVAKNGIEPEKNILLIHGVTYSSHEFDINYKDYSLVRFLAGEGYAVWRLEIHITYPAGSSTILTKEDSVTDCLKCSDKRMYRDKREKRLRGSDKTVLRSAG